MDAAREVAIVSASNATTTVIHRATTTTTNDFNVNQNNNNLHTQHHANTHIGSNSLMNKTISNVISSSNISIGGSSSSNSNSNCSSSSISSVSSNSSGYGSTTTTPTNNYDLQQTTPTTPTTTPISAAPAVGIADHIIPVATVAAVAPFYSESIATHTSNLETHHVQQHHHQHHQHLQHHSQQQQQQLQQHHLLQTNPHQFSQNHLQTNLQHHQQQHQQQQQHHQYLSRQQYYSPYDYQQTTPTPIHSLPGSTATPAVAPYNMTISGSYDLSSSSLTANGAGQYKSSSATGVNYDRQPGVKIHEAAPTYNQPTHGGQQHSKVINQQTQPFASSLASSKQRSSSSLIGNSTNTNSSKPQAAATPFYANPTPFYENYKHKMPPLEYHENYGNYSPTAMNSYHQQQKYYAAAKSQLKEASYGAATGLNSKSLYPTSGNFFSAPTGGLNLSPATYEKYMYPHTSPTGYHTASGHLANEQTPSEVSSYRKPVVGNSLNSSSWPWGIDYASGNSRSIPPPASHLPTATVAPTHATHLPQNPSVLARDPYYLGHDKYGIKYDKYVTPSYQQSYVSPPANRHMWSNTPHGSNILATGPPTPALPSHGIHATSYFSNNSTTSLNSRQSCCSQPYQPQSCYYPPTHPVPARLPTSQNPTVVAPASGYLTGQQPLGQSSHLNALSAASCKYGGVLPDYASANKIKNSNDLYLNTHQHYDNSSAVHNFGYGTSHNSQQLYGTTAHESAPSSLHTNDLLNANATTSYTNDLSLTTSNFDNYHTHLETHHPPSQQHGQQPTPPYQPTVAKRALLDYRKPIQPQPPPSIAEDCYVTLPPRDHHYVQQELLNTPETTTTFGEYEIHESETMSLTTTAVLSDAERAREESNKNLSLRDFIANWNDDEDEYQNNEEMNFDQNTVIDEVLQTPPIGQESVIVATGVVPVDTVEDTKVNKPVSLEAETDTSLTKSVNTVENLTTSLVAEDTNQYVNLPDIVIDIKKSNNGNSSIVTPTTSPPPPPPTEDAVNDTCLNLTNFDVEKELDELNLKKPAQQELNDIKESKSVITPLLSPCKNLTPQLNFEDLNLEPANKTVLNASNHDSELNEQYFKDIEGYESSSSSRHSNESAFEKEYETFINKITSETTMDKIPKKKPDDGDKEIDFVQNVHDFSKFYKRKRKLKVNELKSPSPPLSPSTKKLKTLETVKENISSNFPRIYTKKSRNRLNKTHENIKPSRRKPLSAYYKIIHSIRRYGLYRQKRVREYMAELKEKHLPLIKRQSIKNYSHEVHQTSFNAASLKTLCIFAINTDEFRQSLIVTISDDQETPLESEGKHICTDPTCETCEVIKSLMEAESFESNLMQQPIDDIKESNTFSTPLFCVEGNIESMTTLQDSTTPNTDDINFREAEYLMIPSTTQNIQYSKTVFPAFDTKDPEKKSFNLFDTETNLKELKKPKATIGVENWCKRGRSPDSDDDLEISLPKKSQTIADTNLDHFVSEKSDYKSLCVKLKYVEPAESKIFPIKKLLLDPALIVSANDKLENSNNCEEISTTKTKDMDRSSTEDIVPTRKNQESESDESYSSSDMDSSSSSDTDDDDLAEDSKDSCKKSNDNTESSDSDSDNSDEEDNSDSNLSHLLKKTKSNKSLENKEEKEIPEGNNLRKSKNNRQNTSPAVSLSIENESINADKYNTNTEPEHFVKKAVTGDSECNNEVEENNISQNPQRIVIRITKSLSPNDHSLRVENVFENSKTVPTAIDTQLDDETDGNDVAKRKPETISEQIDIRDECVARKFIENQTAGSFEDKVNAAEKPETEALSLKLTLKRKDSLDDQVSKKFKESLSDSESDLESEFECDDISDTNSEANVPRTLNLGRKEECAGEKFAETHSESELEEGEILDEESEMITTARAKEITNQLNNSDGGTKKETDIREKSITSSSNAKEERMLEKNLESDAEVNKPEATSLRQEDFFNDCSTEITLEPKEEIISVKQPKIKLTYVSEEVEASEKYMEQRHDAKSGFEIDNGTSKEMSEPIVITLRLKPVQEALEEKNTIRLFEKPTEYDEERKSDTLTHSPQDSLDGHAATKKADTFIELENNIENRTNYQSLKLSPKKNHHNESEAESDISEQSEEEKSDSMSSSAFEISQKQNDSKTETFCEKSSQDCAIETYSLSDTDSEIEEEEIDSEKEINAEADNPEINLSDYESIFDSEHETDENDETWETIVISDNDSIDGCRDQNELQEPAITEDSSQQFAKVNALGDISEIKKSLITSETEKNSGDSNNLPHLGCELDDIKPADSDEFSDGKSTYEKAEIQQETNISNVENNVSESSSSSEDSDEEFRIFKQPSKDCKRNCSSSESATDIVDEDVLLECSTNYELNEDIVEKASPKPTALTEDSKMLQETRENQEILSEKTDRRKSESADSFLEERIENDISESSTSSEDSDEEIDDQIAEQPSTDCKKTCSSSKCAKDEDVVLECSKNSELNEDVVEKASPKPTALTEDSKMLEETRENQKILSEKTDRRKSKSSDSFLEERIENDISESSTFSEDSDEEIDDQIAEQPSTACKKTCSSSECAKNEDFVLERPKNSELNEDIVEKASPKENQTFFKSSDDKIRDENIEVHSESCMINDQSIPLTENLKAFEATRENQQILSGKIDPRRSETTEAFLEERFENYVSESSSSSEDSDGEDRAFEQSSTDCKNNFSSNECAKDEDVVLECSRNSEINEDILEKASPKENQSFFKSSDYEICEENIEGHSESCMINDQSIPLTENLKTFEASRKNQQILSGKTDRRKSETNEAFLEERIENDISESSSSSEDSDEEIDNPVSEQPSANCKNNFSSNECAKDEDVVLECSRNSEINKDILEKDSPKENESSFISSDCELCEGNIVGHSQACMNNDKSVPLAVDSRTVEETRENQQILLGKTDRRKSETTEAFLETRIENNISEISSSSEEQPSKGCTKNCSISECAKDEDIVVECSRNSKIDEDVMKKASPKSTALIEDSKIVRETKENQQILSRKTDPRKSESADSFLEERIENYILESSTSSEDSDEEIDDQIAEQPSTDCKKNCSSSECAKDEDVVLECSKNSEINEDILEKASPEKNQSFFKSSDYEMCEKNIEVHSESYMNNDKSTPLTEDSKTFKATRENQQILLGKTDRRKSETTEALLEESIENDISESSSSSEDSDEEIDNQISEQPSTDCKKNCRSIEYAKDIDDVLKCSKDAELNEYILEKPSSKEKQSSFKASDCEFCEEKITKDSKTFDETRENQQILLGKTDRRNSETTESFLVETIENSSTFFEVSKEVNIMEPENILNNLQNEVKECESDKLNTVTNSSYILEKGKSLKDDSTFIAEKIITLESPKSPSPEICDLISKEKPNSLQDIVQESVIIEEMPTEELNLLESEKTILQTISNENDNDSEITPLEANLGDFKNDPERGRKDHINNEDQFANSSTTEECETVCKAKVEETEKLDDVLDVFEPKIGITNALFESANSGDQGLEASEALAENMDKVIDREILEKTCNEEKAIAEVMTKELEDYSSSKTPINISNGNIENISKSAAEKIKGFALSLPENFDILENQNRSKIQEIQHSTSQQLSDDVKDLTSQNFGTASEEINDQSKTAIETEMKMLDNIKEDSGATEELKFDFINKKLDLEEVSEKNLPSQDFLIVSTTSLEKIKGKQECNPISPETTNKKVGDILNESKEIEAFEKSVHKGFEKPSKIIIEASKSSEEQEQKNEAIEINDEEFGNEIQNILQVKSSNNLEEVQLSKEEPAGANESLLKHGSENTPSQEVKTSVEKSALGLPKTKYGKLLEKTEISELHEERLENAHQTLTKDVEIVSIRTQVDTQQQTETFEQSSNQTANAHVAHNDCITPDDMSGDFFGFKHQASFEDESEDFHGFEDLEEVTRIRQEIENLNEDSTANDGFLNRPALDRETHNSSTSSLSESTFSELNELEALEKELTQTQTEMRTEHENKETEEVVPTKPVNKVVSSNDIKHIKQMLESDEEQPTDGEEKISEKLALSYKDKSLEVNKNIRRDIIYSVNSVIPKLSDLCRAALNSSLNSNSNLAQQQQHSASETSAILVERELSVEEALAEMYRQAGVLLSDPEECDNDEPSPGMSEANDVFLINLQEILNSDNNEVYVLQCDMNEENILNVVQSVETLEHDDQEHPHKDVNVNTERVNTVQIILDRQSSEKQEQEHNIHVISSDSESEVIVLSDDDSQFSYLPSFTAHQERVTIPFINDDNIVNDSDSLIDISTIHHEEIVPDNLKKFLQEEFYKYLHEKYVQRNISKYYHANRVLKKYKKIFLRSKRQ